MARDDEFGASWWARRWIGALEGFGWGSRLARGRAYARGGQVVDLEIRPGLVRARVVDSAPQAYRVTIAVERFGDGVWERAFEALASRALFGARLLDGDLPAEVVELCDAVGAPLFPRHAAELEPGCTCPDWGQPCRHVAALHYILASELDRDPLLLFRVRGRTRDEVVAALRARRGGATTPATGPAPASAPRPGSASAPRSGAASSSGTAPRSVPPPPPPREDPAADGPASEPAEPFGADLGRFWDIGSELPVEVEVRPPDVSGAVLIRLGQPPGWGSHEQLLPDLERLYHLASRHAREVAVGKSEADAPEADTPEADGVDSDAAPRSPAGLGAPRDAGEARNARAPLGLGPPDPRPVPAHDPGEVPDPL